MLTVLCRYRRRVEMATRRLRSMRQPELLPLAEPAVPAAQAAAPGAAHIELADALECYAHWPRPTVIVSDGPYGVSGFPGDPPTPDGLRAWYAPHFAEWARYALPETTLWFWGTEI